MANSAVVDLYPDLMGLGRRNLDILNTEVLAGLPCHSCFASDRLGNEVSVAIFCRVKNFHFFSLFFFSFFSVSW